MRSLFYLMSHRLHRLTQISLELGRLWGIKGTRISLMTQIFELCGIRWCFILFCSSLQYRSSKINPAFFVDKASCTRQFESELSLHSLASLFPIKKGFFLPLRLSCKESSTFSPSPSSSGSGDVTALWCSEQLRYKVGGASKPSPCFAGWDRLGHKQ